MGCVHYLKFNNSETILYSYSKQSAQGFDVIKKQIVWQIELNTKSPEIYINQNGRYCLRTQNCIDPIKQQTYIQIENLETQDELLRSFPYRIMKNTY
ncbi:unnamed protein product [Paramecium primaurelia]|uniref:Uncharacterized protein n=1 Tax=Paramecium primaurelia TaxID=5886 RepID=A0A8S1NKL6_PARPR|nr:unnamed protein product [Paramecium primaurelia]